MPGMIITTAPNLAAVRYIGRSAWFLSARWWRTIQ